MTNQKPQQDWEKELEKYVFCCAGDQCDYGDHQEEAKEDMTKIIKQAIFTERQRVMAEVREMVEGLDSYYVLNGNITKHKGGHLLDKDELLQALNKLEEEK